MGEKGSCPEGFEVSIGGYMGFSYSVSKSEKGLLRYTSFSQGYTPYETVTVTPSDEDWEIFRKALDDLDVWNWQPEYPNPDVCDGTQWGIEIHWGEKKIASRGDNNYPGTAGSLSETSDEFSRFLAAVRRLIGNRNFA